MLKKFLTGVILFLSLVSMGHAQIASREKSVLKHLDKLKWMKARTLMDKALEKDTLSPGIHYLYSRFFFSSQNPDFHLDSAHHAILRAAFNYRAASPRERDQLAKINIDSIGILVLKNRIDSAAFDRARDINTEASFQHFIDHFLDAIQHEEAIALRDEAAYLDAVKLNSYQGFLAFVEKYPTARRAPEARGTYERLLYQSKTKDRSLKSYEDFLREHPATPYRPQVEQMIFELSTAPGTVNSFLAYLQKYPRSTFNKQARNILFHLLIDRGDSTTLKLILTDSLRHIYALKKTYSVAFFKDGKFGLMDNKGQEKLPALLSNLDLDFFCDAIEGDVIVANNQLVGLDGKVFFRDSVSAFESLTAGFLFAETAGCQRVVHKSGFVIADCVDEAKLLAKRYIAIRKKEKWALFTLAGKMLSQFEWDDLSSNGSLIVMKRGDRFVIANEEEVSTWSETGIPLLPRFFDSVQSLSPVHTLVASNNQQALVDGSQKELIPYGTHKIRKEDFGYVVASDSLTVLYNDSVEYIDQSKELKINKPWIAIRQSNSWRLLTADLNRIEAVYDSVSFIGPFALGYKRDSVSVHLSPTASLEIPASVKGAFIPGKDSMGFFMAIRDGRKSLYSPSGLSLFTVDVDDLKDAGEGFFVVEKKQKFGLINAFGKVMLPIEYDAIAPSGSHVLMLLKNLKFGAYNMSTNTLIKPQYTKNLNVYKADLLTAFLKDHYGFIDWKGKPYAPATFDEISYWNDSTALVKEGGKLSFYDLQTKRKVGSSLNSIDYLQDTEEEKIAVARHDQFYGVISNKRGFFIPPAFTHVRNIGTAEKPMYFTEKHVEEALIYVVIYYDENGKLLSRHVYEEEDYESLMCE